MPCIRARMTARDKMYQEHPMECRSDRSCLASSTLLLVVARRSIGFFFEGHMAKDGRRLWMQWSPAHFYADSAVVRMTQEQRWRYRDALDFSWMGDSPGEGLESEWRALLAYTAEEWPEVRAVFAAAFAVDGDMWRQKRLIDEFLNATKRSRKGKDAADDRWEAERARREAEHAQSMHQASNGHAQAMQSKSKSKKNLKSLTVIADAITPSPDGEDLTLLPQIPKADDPAKRLRKDWRDAFAEHFWPAYPRKVGKGAALKAWERCYPKGGNVEDEFNRILDGLDKWKRVHHDADPEFIPHPSTWLNQSRWEDEAV